MNTNCITTAALAASILLATGCAKRPDAIVPTAVPANAYMAMGCGQLRQQETAERSALASLSSQQTQAANADAFGVFLVGIPAGSVTGGDKEGEISVSKGKLVAIEQAIAANKC